jgi:hypothetical protein
MQKADEQLRDTELPFFSTGIPSLDTTLKNLVAGDNVVWQVDDIEDYACLVKRFVEYGITTRAPLVYFRFASHRQLIIETPGVEVHAVDPEAGFEHFVGKILNVIERKGRGALYVFDGADVGGAGAMGDIHAVVGDSGFLCGNQFSLGDL